MDFISLLLNPKVIGVVGPMGAILLGVCYFLYRQYIHFRNKYEEAMDEKETLQEKRIVENQEMHKEYFQLANEIEKTLDILISIIKSRRNGNSRG